MKVVVAIALLFAATSVWGQDALRPSDDYLPKRNSFSVGGHVHTFGIGFDLQYRRRFQWNNRFEFVGTFSFSNFKNKEEARYNTGVNFTIADGFVYDKLNWAYVMGFIGGVQYVLVPRSEFSRVEFKAGLSMGPTLVLLKPYYVEVFAGVLGNVPITVQVPYSLNRVYDIFLAAQRSRTLEITDIVGEGSWFQGFGGINTQVGWRMRLDFTLDLSGSSYFVRGINFGLQYDLYGRALPILENGYNPKNWFGGYMGIVLGNAW